MHKRFVVTSVLVTLLISNTFLISNTAASNNVDKIQSAAEQGDVTAQYKLAIMYDSGDGFNENNTQAVKWYREAADQGHGDAQIILGFHYETGEGVFTSDTEAVKWFRKSAKQGNAKGQFVLGFHYEYGYGVHQNNIKAYVWLLLATMQNYDPALVHLDLLKHEMTKAQITRAKSLAQRCIQSAYKHCH